jgi:hypothetical protein
MHPVSKQADLTEPTTSESLAEALAIRLRYVYPGAEIKVAQTKVFLTLPNGSVFRMRVEQVS